MITLKVVVDKECEKQALDLLWGSTEFKKSVALEFHNVDTRAFIPRRTARKIVNDYAVMKLPFVLMVDGENEYAAVYTEDKPLTIERINEKL